MATLLSVATLPFVEEVWVGELPLLAVLQVPKTGIANWVVDPVVIPVMKMTGNDQGSRSPNLIAAQPYAMALTFLLAYGSLLLLVKLRHGFAKPHGGWVLVVLALGDVQIVC
ncbi:MAG: hypothetical protein ACPG31_05430 [Planctomycetota bacterium]